MPSPILVLFLIIATGLILGKVRLSGLSLGASGVIFTALLAGHLGYDIPAGIGQLGLVLFIYGVGLTAGPAFFRAFRQHGKELAALAFILVASGGATAWLIAALLDLPGPLAAGMFAGALTSTPALAAAVEAAPAGSQVAVGYGLAYPLGIIGVVLFVQLLPRLLRTNLDELDATLTAAESEKRAIRQVLVEVRNPAVIGKRLTDLGIIPSSNCQITRVLEGDRLNPVGVDFVLAQGQVVLLLGREFRLEPIIDLLGVRSDRTGLVLDTEHHRQRVVATAQDVVGKSLGELKLLGRFGVTISRIERHEIQFVPDPDDVIQWGDALSVVGEPEALAAFSKLAGHRVSAFDLTDLVSLSIGIVLGVLLGSVSFGLAGREFQLGLVGGPLLVALTAAHFGHIGRFQASVPRASRLLMLELGLVLFLADAGIMAGHDMASVLGQYGFRLALGAAAVVAVPLIVGFLAGRHLFKLDLLSALGGICGGMTSTPGVGAITSTTSSQVPMVAYAVAYPVALILMTLVGRVLVGLI